MSEREIPEELRRLVQEGDVDDARCSYSVWAYPWLHWDQCLRKARQKVHGFGFCTQHAKMVREQLEADNGNPTE